MKLKGFFCREQLDYLNSNVYEIKNKMIYLDLKNNHINSFNDESIKAMYVSSSLQFIYLGNNSWNCDCKDRKTIHFLQTYSDTKIRDKENIKCFSDGKLVSSLDIEEICSNFIWIVLGSTFAVLGLIVACTMTFFYTYSLEIKCWLYNHNFCLRFVTKEDLDEEKIYDAFISYAHQDEAFVENVLVTALETGPNLYKICIHVRDRIGGESTVEQVN